MADYTTTELIARIKSRGMIPTSQETFQNSDFLDFLNEELLHFVVPMIMSVREEFFVASSDTTIGSTSSFDIPGRAIGSKLRDVLIVTSDSNVYSIPRIEPEHIEMYNDVTSSRSGFYLQGDQLKLVGEYNSTDSLRMKYFRRPNELVLQSACALVSSVDTSTGVVTVSSVPSTFDTDETYDIINGDRMFGSRGDGLTASAVGTTDITFSASDVANVEAGDWVCLAEQSPIAQIPYDVFPILILKTAAALLRSVGDPSYQAKEDKVKEMKESLLGLLSDRVEGENRKIVNTNNMAWDYNWGVFNGR